MKHGIIKSRKYVQHKYRARFGIPAKLLNITIYPILCHRSFLEILQFRGCFRIVLAMTIPKQSVAQNLVHCDIQSLSSIPNVTLLVLPTVPSVPQVERHQKSCKIIKYQNLSIPFSASDGFRIITIPMFFRIVTAVIILRYINGIEWNIF